MPPRKRTTTKKAAAEKATAPTRARKAPVKKAAAKKATPTKRTPAKKPAVEKAAAKAPAKRATRRGGEPRQVDPDFLGQLPGQPAAGAEPDPDAPHEPGPVEQAVRIELAALHLDGSALGASAIALAKMADRSDGNATSLAAALREMRMTLTTARGLGGLNPSRTPEGGGDGNVVEESRLQRMRREREERERRGH